MNYEFPRITHINEVLAAIEGEPNFKVKQTEIDGEEITIIDYLLNTPEVFPVVGDVYAALRRECRGIAFNAAGEVVSRPFHKFFNLGEREDTSREDVDLSKGHHVLNKLDGSMIRAIKVGNSYRLGTKAGVTDVSLQAEAWMQSQKYYHDFIGVCLEMGVTPIFEWTSRQQRIVLDYPQDNMVLTALRRNVDGDYMPYDMMVELASYIPCVGATSSYADIYNLSRTVDRMIETEGVVVRFHDGHMVKVKTDWYVLRHRSKDQIGLEKNVLALILEDGIDDVLPFLMDTDKERVVAYQTEVVKGIRATKARLEADCKRYRDTYDRKTFALTVAPTLSANDKVVAFAVWDGRKSVSDVVDHLLQQSIKSATTVNENRALWGGARYYTQAVE